MTTSLLSNIESVPVDSVAPHPRNAHKGDVDGIGESLEENKQFAPIIVQRSTGYVLAGNHTLLAARKLGWATIDVSYVEVDDDAALKIMLAANKTQERADGYDNDLLAAILEELNGDFTGTGWTEGEYDDLIAELGDEVELPYTPTNAAWSETPDEYEARAGHLAGGNEPLAARGIRETVIILPQDDHEELHALFTRIRGISAYRDMTNGEIVLAAVRGLMTGAE
jgi:ParB-like chromosome segregation protein Spo0J